MNVQLTDFNAAAPGLTMTTWLLIRRSSSMCTAEHFTVTSCISITIIPKVLLVGQIYYFQWTCDISVEGWELSLSVSVSGSMCQGLCSGEECEACLNMGLEVCFYASVYLKRLLCPSLSPVNPLLNLPPPSPLALWLHYLSLTACVRIHFQPPHGHNLSLTHTHKHTLGALVTLGRLFGRPSVSEEER